MKLYLRKRNRPVQAACHGKRHRECRSTIRYNIDKNANINKKHRMTFFSLELRRYSRLHSRWRPTGHRLIALLPRTTTFHSRTYSHDCRFCPPCPNHIDRSHAHVPRHLDYRYSDLFADKKTQKQGRKFKKIRGNGSRANLR